MDHVHHYEITVTWTGNTGTGTSGYRAYARDHDISGQTKSTSIAGSSDPAFRGDPSRYSPEDLVVASLSACHMLWFLHFCANAGIIVTSYEDLASGTMRLNPDGSGEFTSVTLHPRVVISEPSRIGDTAALHAKAHQFCFIARSMNFPVTHEPIVTASLALGTSSKT